MISRPAALAALLLIAAPASSSALPGPPPDAAYAYGTPAFSALVQDSYTLRGLSTPAFAAWLEGKYQSANLPLSGGKTLLAGLTARQAAIAAASGAKRDELAQDTAQWAHTFIKKILPTFSLERGYEFAFAVQNGERQCLLQSLLIAALLQRTGLDAGAVMVWQNDKGQESNLGHVVALLRLPSGQAALLDDASDPQPFITHQGLLVREGSEYRFVHPVYDGQKINAFLRADTQAKVALGAARPLDLAYLRSQVNYYRGERAPGGFMGAGGNNSGKSDAAGLSRSAAFLRRAVEDNPHNALATYVLGLVERKQGQLAQAKVHLLAGAQLYKAQGHLPAGPAGALTWAQGQ
ncbi:hypothetical protein DKM44_00540 [Deinococcus irradiatisoli]|uniref:Transglutaminase-like domain-containing protein n=1 Tax=Deinococcus irradiatisoli TaxID=2202254 RepID=A0A2Z3JG82_9DEIO|nr:hypothetical protein [Deinococcus irradiatisoli]AWN21909.1 hypothetical protein DKM44_00540 [Deinococcus irradiatisoli]